MPVFTLALWAKRADRPRLWYALLLLILGAHDGLILVIAGMPLLIWAGANGGVGAQQQEGYPSDGYSC